MIEKVMTDIFNASWNESNNKSNEKHSSHSLHDVQ